MYQALVKALLFQAPQHLFVVCDITRHISTKRKLRHLALKWPDKGYTSSTW